MIAKIESGMNRVVSPFESLAHRYILAPFRYLLSKIDPLAKAIEGTMFKKILQLSIYPIFMVATFVIGFKLIEHGYTVMTFVNTILMYLIFGLIFAPLERLIPFSKRWLDDKELPTDWFMFFGGKLWGDYINQPLRLATIALVVQKISPEIGHQIWPIQLHPVVQVLLLLSINDFLDTGIIAGCMKMNLCGDGTRYTIHQSACTGSMAPALIHWKGWYPVFYGPSLLLTSKLL